MNVKKCNPNCIAYVELGRMPISVALKARMIGFWERILTGKREKISQTLHNIIHKLDVAGVHHFKWFRCVKEVFTTSVFSICWKNQSPESILH